MPVVDDSLRKQKMRGAEGWANREDKGRGCDGSTTGSNGNRLGAAYWPACKQHMGKAANQGSKREHDALQRKKACS